MWRGTPGSAACGSCSATATPGTVAPSMRSSPPKASRPCSPRTGLHNGHIERLIGGLRREVLDHVLILGRRHLVDVLREYIAHHNSHRPHRGLGLPRPHDVGRPIPGPGPTRPEAIKRREILGGLIHEYHPRV